MPNWCFNYVVFKGSPEDRQAFRELMGADRGAFDFNAIEPMPAELLECNCSDETAYELKYGEWEAEPWWGANYETRDAALEAARHPQNAWRWCQLVFGPDGKSERLERSFDDAADLAYANVIRHGFPYWHDWRCEHWGTKWSATRVDWETDPWGKDDDAELVTFDTAWSPPVPILEQLAGRFPQADIRADWDLFEDGQRGRLVFARGELVSRSNETYDPYAELKPQ